MVGILFLSTVVGCAATRRTTMDQMELRIGELEREIAQRDDEIDSLEGEVVRLQSELRRKQRASVEAAPASSGKYGDIIRVSATPGQVQTALKKAGYYQGNIDGKIGSGTKSAIVQFQKDNNLKADGVVGRQTWQKLQEFAE